MLIHGSMVALVTPMTPDGAVDWEAYPKQLRSYQANVATAIIMQYAIKPILNGDIHSIHNKKWIGFRYPVFYDIFPCCYHIITICVDTQNKWQNQNNGNKPKKAV